MAAGLATLKVLREGNIYRKLEEKGRILFEGLTEAAGAAGVKVVVNRVGSLGTLFFTEEPVTDFASAKRSNGDLFKQFYANMLDQGIYLAPSPFEAWFVSDAHDAESIQKTIECAARSFRLLKKNNC